MISVNANNNDAVVVMFVGFIVIDRANIRQQ